MKSKTKRKLARKPLDTTPLYLRIPTDIHRALADRATEERMTLSMFARITLVNAMRVKKSA